MSPIWSTKARREWTMPNLLNFSNYIATAMANTMSNGLWIGSNQIVAGALSNAYTPNPGGNAGNVTPQTGLYVVGTPPPRSSSKAQWSYLATWSSKGQSRARAPLYVGETST
jgi:hypothetical protein